MTEPGCLFCRIIAREIPADIVEETPDVVALKDVRPQAPVHLLLIPRKHVASLDHVGDGETAILGRLAHTAAQLAKRLGLIDGYRVVVNCGPQAGQTVYHLHFHLLGGRPLGWPPG